MVELHTRLAPNEGDTLAALDGVRFIRVSRPAPRMPVLYEPSIVVVCQGRKLGYLGERSFVYDAQQYLVLSVPLPFECETFASHDEPFLAISIRVDLAVIAEPRSCSTRRWVRPSASRSALIRRRSTRRWRMPCCDCSKRSRRRTTRACWARSCARSRIGC